MLEENRPRWLRELRRNLLMKTLFLLHGNIYDQFLYPVPTGESSQMAYLPLRRLLHYFFREQGYEIVSFYDQVDGIAFFSETERITFQKAMSGKVQSSAPATATSGEETNATLSHLRDPDAALDAVRRVIATNTVPLAFILDYASRLLTAPEHLPLRERQQFVKLLKISREASRKPRGANFGHAVVLIGNKLNEFPAWLYLDNPLAKPLPINLPQPEERRSYFMMAAEGFFNDADFSGAEREKNIEKFVDLTSGLRNYELEALRLISQQEKIPFYKPKNIIELYKFGVVENPWEKLGQEKGRDKLVGAEEKLRQRVKGQEVAIRAVVEIIKRAVTGLSGIHHSTGVHKPRGILFFAGPTGVGKTELAKALAELLFGDENACIRFDMSEYAQEHSDQRLLGAPPGYVGYEEGGQLTNRVKESPFTVLLFDEIEKAHPKIMDKFLQILEDGRMTDSKGETVYFSESVIIFTSNIGAYVDIPADGNRVIRKPNILPFVWCCPECAEMSLEKEKPANCPKCGLEGLVQEDTPYELIKEKIMAALEEHFKLKLGRPEIYNRIGNNFVVFDYIRPKIIIQIIEKILAHIVEELQKKRGIVLSFAPAVQKFLLEQATGNIDQGGRGIGNLIETAVVNPLAVIIFDQNLKQVELQVKNICQVQQEGAAVFQLETEVLPLSEKV